MKRLAVLSAAALICTGALATTDAQAGQRGRGAAIAAGVVGGLAAGALIGAAASNAYAAPAYSYGYAPAYDYDYAPAPVYYRAAPARRVVYDYDYDYVPAYRTRRVHYYAPAYSGRTYYAPARYGYPAYYGW